MLQIISLQSISKCSKTIPLFFIFYPQSIGDIALQIRQKHNSTLYLIVCKDTKIDCTYLGTHSRLYLSDFKDKQSTNYFLGTEIKNDTESAQEPTLSQKDDYLELDKNGDDIADYQQEYINYPKTPKQYPALQYGI